MKQRTGRYIIYFAIACGFLETAYFGYNFNPASPAELSADILCLAVAMFGCFLMQSKGNEEEKAR